MARYNEESARLDSFRDWTITFIDKQKLARYGFYYVGPEDKVKCHFCRVEIGRWDVGDNVLREHLRWSLNCPLLRRQTTDNVPVDAAALEDSLPPPPPRDVCGNNNEVELRPLAYPENDPPPSFTSNYPDYTLESDRIKSFEAWPKAIKQKPNDLSEAGFFYIGKGDQVKCFSCGGGLKDWEESDVPWDQHALWYPKCHYLNLIQGKEFIERINREYEAATANNGGNPITGPTPDRPIDEAGTSSERQTPHEEPSDAKLCKICFTNELNAALIPCMHVVACAKCAVALKTCPICRTKITDVKRIFFS